MTSPCGKIRIPINEEGNEKAGPDPGIPGQLPRRRHPAHRDGLDRPVRDGRRAAAQRREAARHHRHLLRAGGQAHSRAMARDLAELQQRNILVDGKPGELLLQIFSENQLGPDLLRVHPAQGRRGLRRRQLQGAVRDHRARPDAPRRARNSRHSQPDASRSDNHGVEPVVYGASERPPRGDYSRAGADYTCPQNYAGYTQADHDTYRRLYERQAALVPGRACDEFIGRAAVAGREGPHPALRGDQRAPAQGHRAGRSWRCRA